MKILVVSSSDSTYNSLRPDSEIYIGLANHGHQITIITHGDSDYARRYKELGIEVFDCHPDKKISLKTIKLIRSLLSTQQFDVVYATNSKAIPNAAFGCIGFAVKLVTYRGTTGGLYRHDPSAYLTHLHPRVNGVICVSEAVREDVVKWVWKNKNNVVTIHKGHDRGWYNKPAADLSEFGITKNDFVVICAVNARPSKGIVYMLDATKGLVDIQNMHLLLAVKNMDCEPYASLISDSKMKARIHVIGYRHDVPELIAASNLLVQPSISGEGLPRTVMEAMGYGVPSIVITTGGSKEVVEDGVNGFVIPVKDFAAIAERIRYLYQHPERVENMSEQCKIKIDGELSH